MSLTSKKSVATDLKAKHDSVLSLKVQHCDQYLLLVK